MTGVNSFKPRKWGKTGLPAGFMLNVFTCGHPFSSRNNDPEPANSELEGVWVGYELNKAGSKIIDYYDPLGNTGAFTIKLFDINKR